MRGDVDRSRGAFTLAEVLITLGIIGVVAAMTMPTLIAKHQKQVTVNKLKKAYSVLGQMVTKSYADNGSVELGTEVNEAKTKEFFDNYWLKYFNGAETAPVDKYIYGEKFPFKTIKKVEYNIGIFTNYKDPRILFTTNDGTNYFVYLTQWNNEGIAEYSLSSMSVYVDLNGISGPNILGKDIFCFIIDYKTLRVTPAGSTRNTATIDNECKNGDGVYCAAKIMRDGWQISNDYPW